MLHAVEHGSDYLPHQNPKARTPENCPQLGHRCGDLSFYMWKKLQLQINCSRLFYYCKLKSKYHIKLQLIHKLSKIWCRRKRIRSFLLVLRIHYFRAWICVWHMPQVLSMKYHLRYGHGTAQWMVQISKVITVAQLSQYWMSRKKEELCTLTPETCWHMDNLQDSKTMKEKLKTRKEKPWARPSGGRGLKAATYMLEIFYWQYIH